jgi:hypothetical protein
MAYPKMKNMVREAGVKWVRRLRSAAVTSRNSWLQEIKSVEEECVLVRQIIASLPLPIASVYINHYIIREFINIIASYDYDNGRPQITRICDGKVHRDICVTMLKTVIFPCIFTCDIREVESEFVQELLIKLLYIIPNVEILILPNAQRLNYMPLLVRRIQLLIQLQEFHFHVGCTTEILIELSKYCPHLKKISVEGSRRVNDECVRHLLKLRHVLSLDIADTQITTNGYTALLSGLPEIQTVIWYHPIDPVLRNLRAPLLSVTKFTGNVSDARLLVINCPNITELTLLSTTEDISGVGELRNVTMLSIQGGSYIALRFNNIITFLGRNLTVLKMGHVVDISINDLVNSCTVLNSLEISSCHVVYTEMLEPELPHFRNVKELRLIGNRGQFGFNCILRMYANLNVLHVVAMEQINDMYITGVVMAGGFRNLTEFIIDLCGYLSMETAWLLLQNCPDLTELGNIGSWSGVTEDAILIFLNFIKNNNLSLVVHR